MSYLRNEDLPKSIRDQLPPGGQDIYREGINHAYRYGRADEATADRIAWAAVKRHYEQAGDKWVPRVKEQASVPHHASSRL